MNLACEFARHGHKVTVVCRKLKDIRIDYEDIDVKPIVETWNKKAIAPVCESDKNKKDRNCFLAICSSRFPSQRVAFWIDSNNEGNKERKDSNLYLFS